MQPYYKNHRVCSPTMKFSHYSKEPVLLNRLYQCRRILQQAIINISIPVMVRFTNRKRTALPYTKCIQALCLVTCRVSVEKRYLLQRAFFVVSYEVLRANDGFQTWDSPKVSKINSFCSFYRPFTYWVLLNILNFEKGLWILPFTFFPFKTLGFINKDLTIVCESNFKSF